MALHKFTALFRFFFYYYLLINSATPLVAALPFIYLNRLIFDRTTKRFLFFMQRCKEEVKRRGELRESWKSLSYFECMHSKSTARK